MSAAIELLIAFLCAALSGMGVGGGGLLLIYLSMATDIGQHRAQLYNLLFFLCASSSSLILHAYRRKIDLRATLILSAAGVPGAILGSVLSGMSGEKLLGLVVGGFLFLSGTVSLFSKDKGK